MARCLVIGANGFLGSHLVDELANRGHSVTAFDRFSRQNPVYSAGGVTQFFGDFMNQSDVRDAVSGHDFVFHFVSTTTPATAENDPILDVRTNISFSVELFQTCIDVGVKKVFFASTGGAIYGDQLDDRVTEEATPFPISPYGIGKLAIEGYLRYFKVKHGLDSVSFRISNPYGTRQYSNKKQGVIPIFLHRVANRLPLIMLGDGSTVRDYLFVDDLVRMIGLTLEKPTTHSVYNIGSGVGTSLLDLLEIISQVTGLKPEVDQRAIPSTYLNKVVLNADRFCNEFGYSKFVSLEEGISTTWEQIRQGNGLF